MTQLADDLTAYTSAADASARQVALVQLLSDIIDAVAQLEQVAITAAETIHASKRLEMRLLRSGLVWNPERLDELTAEGVT